MPLDQTAIRRRRTNQTSPANSAATDAHTADSTATRNTDSRRERTPPRDTLRQFIVRCALVYLLYQYYWKGKNSLKASQTSQTDKDAAPTTGDASVTAGLGSLLGAQENVPSYYKIRLTNAWDSGIRMDFRVFVNLKKGMHFEETSEKGREDCVWEGENIQFATVTESYLKKNITLSVPEEVSERNGTWFAHVFVVKAGLWEKSNVPKELVKGSTLYARHELIKWIDVDSRKKGKRLLGGDQDEDEETNTNKEEEEQNKEEGYSVQAVRYDQTWKPTMPITIVTNAGPVVLGQLPATAARGYRVDVERKTYYPPMQINEFWMLRDTLRPMNDTVKSIIVEMSFEPMSLYKWSMYKQFDNAWEKQVQLGTMQSHESDELKRMFVETNPVLLGTTMVVSMAHTILEALAFKNDISHWRNIKSMEGVSVRSMIWKIAMEAIIFLYLWDNDTSWMITIGNGIGVAIAIWKLGKAVKFENIGKRKLFGFIPWFDMVDRESYSKETKEYDEQAMKYMGYALYPLVAMYALYSLRYEKHKSWYSWVISSLVGAVYAFGFIMMFPQIFINYKLKSVAHMPMKAMMYKTLNTVIDDLFSFIIKMPWLHRLACFRDDIVFLILLYQRWIYPVDKKRVNEFGQAFDENGQEVLRESTVTSESTELETEKKDGRGEGQTNEQDQVKEDRVDTEAEEKTSEEKKND